MPAKKTTAHPAVQRNPAVGQEKSDSIETLENKTIRSMETALENVRKLSETRINAKQSVSRLTGVARELRELIKVMSVYGC